MSSTTEPWKPSAEQMELWPAISGNTINGVGEAAPRRATPIYWHPPDATPHGQLQLWFYKQVTLPVLEARKERQRALDEPLEPIASVAAVRDAAEWTALVKDAARAAGADAVGIARMRPEWVFEGHSVTQAWIVVIAVAHDWEQLSTAPKETAAAEVIRQYGRGVRVVKAIANAIRREGHAAEPLGGPMAGSVVLIPAAIAAGLGELGKHGSLIHRTLGSNFRLACVLTDVPLASDEPDDFGADTFCTLCHACSDACPPEALAPTKQLVRGEVRWYVDFDRCLPFFNEHQGCAICLAACPWSHPGVAPTLVRKMAARKARPT